MIKFERITATFVILVVLSALPIAQIFILTGNGAFLALLSSERDESTVITHNMVASVFMFILYVLSKKQWTNYLIILGIIFFYLPLIFYSLGSILGKDINYFILQFCICTVVTASILLAMLIKRRLG